MPTPLDLFLALRWTARLLLLPTLAVTAWCVWGFVTDAGAHHSPAAPIGLLAGAVLWVLFWISTEHYRDSLRVVQQTKPVRYRKIAVLTKPEGEYVRVAVFKRGWATPTTERFHAEDEAERAMEFVRRQRESLKKEITTTPAARSLASVLRKAA